MIYKCQIEVIFQKKEFIFVNMLSIFNKICTFVARKKSVDNSNGKSI